MAGKKDMDATKNLRPDEPTQVLPKGTKTGLPSGRTWRSARRFARKPVK